MRRRALVVSSMLLEAPPDTLAAARKLPRIGMATGRLHEACQRGRGVTNSVPLLGRAEALAAVRVREVSMWFCELPQPRAHPGRFAQLGRPTVLRPAWRALNHQTSGIPVSELCHALGAPDADSSLDQISQSFLGAA